MNHLVPCRLVTAKEVMRNVLPLFGTELHIRCYSAGTVFQKEEPFYGRPRYDTTEPSPLARRGRPPYHRSVRDRMVIALHNATTAFADPTRADAVAALGEITGHVTLRRMHQRMLDDKTGCLILQERPVVSKATIPYQDLIDSAPDDPHGVAVNGLTFGQAYGSFLKSHGFDPDGRDKVKYIEDESLAYVMLRYRQCHDFWHALTGLPPTVLGELGIKWLELFQTGLPVAALSCTVGSLQLDREEREILMKVYLPWAIEACRNSKNGFMLNVYYEKEFNTPLEELRRRLNLTAPPRL